MNRKNEFDYDTTNRFRKPKGEVKKSIWYAYVNLCKAIKKHRMASREKTIALERLEESYMWLIKNARMEEGRYVEDD